jgi:hypothetical protein
MKKIPTIFERDWNGDRSRVLDQINPDAQWVFDGEGVATQKIDGTCCMVRDGKMFKRRETTFAEMTNKNFPDFEVVEHDTLTGKVVGWILVGDGPEDRWHREAFALERSWPDGSYELVGPKVQGNPELATTNKLIAHNSERLILEMPPTRTFGMIRDYLASHDIEGIVYHHPDGRMAKIKGKDFGFKRGKAKAA